jgi:phage terminase small subunit
MNNLTPKQEKFVQGLISGLSQRESFKRAGYSIKGKTNEYIDIRASELMKNSKVSVRYRELVREHQEKALWTREDAVNDLIWLKEQAKNDIQVIGVKQANTNAMLNAIKELNELEDLYVKQEEKEQYEDDGFLAALDGKEVNWDEET